MKFFLTFNGFKYRAHSCCFALGSLDLLGFQTSNTCYLNDTYRLLLFYQRRELSCICQPVMQLKPCDRKTNISKIKRTICDYLFYDISIFSNKTQGVHLCKFKIRWSDQWHSNLSNYWCWLLNMSVNEYFIFSNCYCWHGCRKWGGHPGHGPTAFQSGRAKVCFGPTAF